MSKINAVITGIGGYVPEDIISNADLCRMVDTTEDWILTRVGIHERRILKKEGVGTSYLGIKAVEDLIAKTGLDPKTVDGIIFATTTPDYHFPSTSTIVSHEIGCGHAFCFDVQAACTGFIYALEIGANFIRTGRYKKLIVIGGEKMTSMTDYTDRQTCPLFGDGCGAALLEPTTEEYGIMDAIIRADGVGRNNLIMKAGGSANPPTHETVDRREHYIYQEGRTVFRFAVLNMCNVTEEIVLRNKLSKDDIAWIIPHQANLRIISAVADRIELPEDKIMINIQRYGNTSAGSIPLCLWEWENQLKKGDNIILTAFGAGFTYGSMYIKWGYDGKKA